MIAGMLSVSVNSCKDKSWSGAGGFSGICTSKSGMPRAIDNSSCSCGKLGSRSTWYIRNSGKYSVYIESFSRKV